MSSIFKAFKNITKPSVNKSAKGLKEILVETDEMVSYVALNNGLKIPRIGLGTYGVKDRATCLKLFDEAISIGYRMFDTGSLYGNEQFIGDVVYDKLSTQVVKREDIFIGTKVAPFQHGKSNTTAAVNESLKRLKLSYVDLVLVHWPGVAKMPQNDPSNKKLRAETWHTLEELVSQNKIKSIGVSNYTVSHLEDLLTYCKIKPTVNQVEFHPMCFQKQLLDFCKTNSIHLQAYSSLGSSQSKPPGWTVLFNDSTVKAIASKHNRTIPQVLLRWGFQHDCILIPKTSRVENLESNLKIFDFQLDDEDMESLNKLNKDKHFCWNPADII